MSNKIIKDIRKLEKANKDYKEKNGNYSRTITTTVMELRSKLSWKEKQKL